MVNIMKRNKTSIFLISLLSLIGFFLIVTFQSFTPSDTITGEEIYRLNCAGCHGINRIGQTNMYPSLIDVKERLTKEQISKQIENGKGLMPAFAHLSYNEKKVLIAFLYDEKTEPIKGYATNIGEGIFKSNCTSCHRAFVNDPKPINSRMMEPPPLAGITHSISKNYFFRVVENGRCYMPSFNHFTKEDKEELYTYLNSFEYQGYPTRISMRCRCSGKMSMRRN